LGGFGDGLRGAGIQPPPPLQRRGPKRAFEPGRSVHGPSLAAKEAAWRTGAREVGGLYARVGLFFPPAGKSAPFPAYNAPVAAP